MKFRRLKMGLQTVTGLKRQGFFIPYRYAETVPETQSYPEIEALMAKADMATWLAKAAAHLPDLLALQGPPPLPRFAQDWFPGLDAAIAWTLTRDLKPKRIIEVGAGHSTRFLAHAAQGTADHHVIDPAPRADLQALDIQWTNRVLTGDDIPQFHALEAGDIAFFDSSHILMPGTDVDLILSRILPGLQSGVLVHIHDILLPDPYPESWLWRGYNEQNAIAPLLTAGWEILFSSHYARTRLDIGPLAELPLQAGAHETSLWLRKR